MSSAGLNNLFVLAVWVYHVYTLSAGSLFHLLTAVKVVSVRLSTNCRTYYSHSSTSGRYVSSLECESYTAIIAWDCTRWKCGSFSV